MKLRYRIGHENIHETKLMMLAQQPDRTISMSQLFYAELFVDSEVEPDKTVELGNIPVLYFLADLYFFAQEHKDEPFVHIKGISDENQAYWIELCKTRSRLTLTSRKHKVQQIKLPFPSEDHLAALAKKFVQGYIKRVPELANYSGMKHVEKEFGFTL
ncbi:hypothetical protein EON83_28110 [bacterium]|nr:MAG: hypothetical protein EON83_28110 [bacterium]